VTWNEWTDWFMVLYGVPDGKRPTVVSWIKEAFVPNGRTPDELHAAALDVFRGGAPSWLGDVGSALVNALRHLDADRILARDEQDRTGGLDLSVPVCPCCGGTGLASVPRRPTPANALAKGYMQLCYVSCKCAAGRRVALVCRNHKDERMLTLDEYERDWPDWLADRRAYEREQAALGEATANAGPMADAVARLRERQRKMGGRR
jgi:hypothetical protein